MSETRYARAEVTVDGQHMDAQLVKITPETGDLERLTLTFPISFKGFLTMGKVDVKVVVEFDPPVTPSSNKEPTP